MKAFNKFIQNYKRYSFNNNQKTRFFYNPLFNITKINSNITFEN